MDIREHVIALNEKRARAAKQLNDHLDECHNRHPGEVMSEEEREKETRIQDEIDGLEEEIRRFVAREERERESAKLREAADSVFGPAAVEEHNKRAEDGFRAWVASGATGDFELQGMMQYAQLRAQMRSGLDGKELRNALLTDTGSIGSAVPTLMASTLYEYLENTIAMFRAPTTKITTSGGETMEFPKLTAHSIGTQVAGQGTALAGTDPTFDKLSLGAYKYGQLVAVSSEAITDTAFPLETFLGRDMGRGLGRDIDEDLVVGSGSGEPQGIMGGSWGSVATGGTLIEVDYENLVDLVYGIADEYVNASSTGWLMNRSTAGSLRKLRDGAGGTVGAVLWEPSLTAGIQNGEPDRLLSHPVYTDPNVAAQGSAAKAIWFGDFSSYYVRQVGNVMIERSNDYLFNVDEVAFRAKWRVDGDIIDTNAGIVSHQRT